MDFFHRVIFFLNVSVQMTCPPVKDDISTSKSATPLAHMQSTNKVGSSCFN